MEENEVDEDNYFSPPTSPLPLILLQAPNCTNIPEDEFKIDRFVMFENKHGTGAGVISKVIPHWKTLKVDRYAQVKKHVWVPYDRKKHRHLVEGVFVIDVVWIDYEDVLAIADLPSD
jgi:hypothetical protein